MDIELELQSSDPAVLAKLMGRSDVPEGAEVELGNQVRLRYLGSEDSRGGMEVIPVLISFSAGISSSLLASLLYDYLKNREIKITISFVIQKYKRIPIDITSPEDTVKVLEKIAKEKENAKK
jgi:hypothetical protein